MDDHSPRFPGDLERGMLVAGFKIRQRIGAGATGTVYAAIHPGSGQKVAVKVIHSHLVADAAAAESFETELRRLAALQHPGVVPLLDVGRLEGDRLYLISDFALGQPLSDLTQSAGPFTPVEARPIIEALALILATAHGRGFVHGGLTPDNIWVSPQEEVAWPPMVRIMDFGLGGLRHGHDLVEETSPYYLSPEQCRGEPPQLTSDVYALGVITYQLLTGRLPFSSATPAEVIRMHLEDAPRRPSELARVGPSVDALVLKALAKDPALRFQTMLQLRQSLVTLSGAPLPPSDEGLEPPTPEGWPSSARGEIEDHGGPQRGGAAAAMALDSVVAEEAEPEPELVPAADLEPEPPASTLAPPAATAPPSPAAAATPMVLPSTVPLPSTAARPSSAAMAARTVATDASTTLPPARITSVAITPAARGAALGLSRDATVDEGAAALAPGATTRLDPAAITGVLPLLREPPRRGTPLFAALLGVLIAGAVGLGSYRLLAGHWPWTNVDAPAGLEGQIVLVTIPSGATVYLNNVEQRGQTPLTLTTLQRGQPYDIALQLPGHAPWRQTVALGLAEEERQLQITLDQGPPHWGTLHLRASEKADFFLDTRKVGTQTKSVTLAEVRSGVDHELRVSAPGFKTVTRSAVRVEAGKAQVLQFDLEPHPGEQRR